MDKNSQTKPEHQLTELDPIAMQAPVEVKIKVHLKMPAGKSANLEFCLPPGQVPTRNEIQEIIDTCMDQYKLDISGIPAGTRMMDKREFVAHITKRETGMEIQVPGGEFAPSAIDIPRAMLMHAIHGQGEPHNATVARQYLVRDAAAIDNGGAWFWHQTEIDKLDDCELLALYKEITHA